MSLDRTCLRGSYSYNSRNTTQYHLILIMLMIHALADNGTALGYRPDTTCLQRVTVTIINGRDILKFAESGVPSTAHNPVRIKLNFVFVRRARLARKADRPPRPGHDGFAAASNAPEASPGRDGRRLTASRWCVAPPKPWPPAVAARQPRSRLCLLRRAHQRG